jgi:TRAP-type C4-dicarboxylate transport system substrate-binding protein
MNKFLFTLLALAIGSAASAATLKIATVTPEGSQWMTEMRESAREIKERTEGRVQIKYYGGGVMGNDAKVLGKIRIGALQGGAFTPAALSDVYPDLNIYGMPLVFDSEEEAAYVRKRLDSKLQQGLEAEGFVNFGFASGGFAMVMSNTPVKSLDDLRGKRVWVPEGDSISYSSMEAMSLAPVMAHQGQVHDRDPARLYGRIHGGGQAQFQQAERSGPAGRSRSDAGDLREIRPRKSRRQPRGPGRAVERRHRERAVRRRGSGAAA